MTNYNATASIKVTEKKAQIYQHLHIKINVAHAVFLSLKHPNCGLFIYIYLCLSRLGAPKG
jgi:hypothetical protein